MSGFLIERADAPEPPWRHRFCGEHAIDGAHCPSCRKPLLCFLRIDGADPRTAASRFGAIEVPLLFCWTCDVAQHDLFYRVEGEGRVRLLSSGSGGCQTDFPYEQYPAFFPERPARLRPVPTPLPHHPAHQVGGHPWLVQPRRPFACVECSRAMHFFAVIADDSTGPRGFTDNPFVQVLYQACFRCGVLGAYQACD
jgi:hypothetical protein